MHWVPNFIKIGHIAILETKTAQVFNCRSRFAISNVIFMIDKLGLLWLPDFLALGIYFSFGTRFSWNEGIDTCFNVECVLLGRNFDFLGGYCSLPSGYYPLLFVTWWLLVVTARSHFYYERWKSSKIKNANIHLPKVDLYFKHWR